MRIRIPWTPLVATVLVGLSAGLAVQPVRDAATLRDVPEAYLTRPVSYVAMAPLSNVLDTLTLLSASQHIALVVGVAVLFAIWRLRRARRADSTWRSHLIASGTLVIVIAIVYVAAAVLPRPMAALVADNANILRVDFHSHTSASHDGRRGWTVEDNRAWHRSAGYDVTFVTDHATVAAAEQGIANNPNPVAADVTILQGIEVTWTGEHVAILGAERTYKGLLTPNNRDVDEQGLRLASLITGREPIVVWNHPREINRLPVASGSGTAGVRAIEIVNGSPADMDRLRQLRRDIIVLASGKNIALTSGSDHHGWGRAPPAWTILRIMNWRGLHADALALHVENVIRQNGYRGTRVVERRVTDAGTRLALWLTVFYAPMRMLTTLSNDERVMWLVWIWGMTASVWWIRRRRARA